MKLENLEINGKTVVDIICRRNMKKYKKRNEWEMSGKYKYIGAKVITTSVIQRNPWSALRGKVVDPS